jgi:hypothetical protein
VSNRKRLPQEVPPGIAATAKAARCSDCAGRGQARFRGGEWEIKFWHGAGCPADTETTGTLHADAEASVKRAAERTGTELSYERISDAQGFITGSGLLVTAGGQSGPVTNLSWLPLIYRERSTEMWTCGCRTGGVIRSRARGVTRGGPARVIVSWTPCGCAGGDGHLRVRCRERSCTSAWYQPPHQPGAEVTGRPG